MEKHIHPEYYHNVTVRCACGDEFVTGSVVPGPIRVEICAACHPFFTGEQKFVDTEGRVERFQRKQQEASVARERRAGAQPQKGRATSAAVRPTAAGTQPQKGRATAAAGWPAAAGAQPQKGRATSAAGWPAAAGAQPQKGRAMSAAGRPKTLREMLEEVRT